MDYVEHKILRGEGAGKWLPFARQKVVALHARARAMRVTALVQRWTVEGGDVEIAVRVNGEQRYIHIRRKTCRPFLSGLCDLVLHKEGDVIGAEIPLTPIYQVDDPDDPDPAATIDVFRRFYPSPETKAADRAWRDTRALAGSHDAAKQMITLKASMFSGEMRKVVQVLQGAGVFIPYSPTFGLTHGVFKASSGQRWVIEISNQGVVAWVMGMCRNPIRDAAGAKVLEYTPIATPKPANIAVAKAAGAYVDLAPASTVLDVYTKSAFFTNCGWAFNTAGHAAVNVCWNFVDGYVKSRLYKLTITEDDDGRPVTAQLSLLREGWIHGPLNCGLKYPDANLELYSFDTRYNNANFIYLCDAPVYAFYTPDDSLHVVAYRYTPNTGHVDTYSDTFVAIHSDACIASNLFGAVQKNGTITRAPQAHLDSPEWHPALEYTSTASYSRQSIGTPSFLGAQWIDNAASQCITFVDAIQLIYGLSSYLEDSVSETDLIKSVFLVPWHERCGYYMAERIDRSESAGSTAIRFSPVNDGYQSISVRNTTCLDAEHPNTLVQVSSGTCRALNCPSPADWWLNCCLGGDTEAKYFLGVTLGDVFVAKSIIGGVNCLRSQASAINAPLRTQIGGPATTRTSRQFNFRYVGPGGVRALPEPADSDNLFELITDGVVQKLVAVTDAFDADTYIISPTVNFVHGVDGLVTTAGAYPVSQAGGTFNFIGVP